MKRTIISASLVLALIITCAAAIIQDITGTYKGKVDFQGTQLDLTYKLKAEGEKLTGSIISSYGTVDLQDGKISGNDFSYSLDFGNGPMPSTGKYYGDSIVVTAKFGDREIKNTFKRVAEAK
jgi:hypothetical protein